MKCTHFARSNDCIAQSAMQITPFTQIPHYTSNKLQIRELCFRNALNVNQRQAPAVERVCNLLGILVKSVA
jgi:hypothetical protein